MKTLMSCLASCLVLFLLMASVAAQTAPTQPAPAAAELTKLLNDFLAGASVNDAAMHDRFWAEDLIYTRSAGRRVTKAEIMKDVRSAPAPKPEDPKVVYTAEDIRIQQYGDTAVVAFRLVATTQTGENKEVQYLLNTGTFVKRNEKWQVVSWQATRIPRTEEENRADIAAVTAAFREALRSNDVKKVSALTDAKFVWTEGSDKETTRQQLIDNLSAITLKRSTPETPKELISVFGEAAVVRGDLSGGKYTMTLVNQGGTWKIVALHSGK
jgi:ketosteroid isomerase-like protein